MAQRESDPSRAEMSCALTMERLKEEEPGVWFSTVLCDIVTAASLVCEVPIAAVTLRGPQRLHLLSDVGMGRSDVPLRDSLCVHAMRREVLMLVPDVKDEPRFLSSPLVLGAPFIRSYAAAVIRGTAGRARGTVFVADRSPRRFSMLQRVELVEIARWAELAFASRETERSGRRRA